MEGTAQSAEEDVPTVSVGTRSGNEDFRDPRSHGFRGSGSTSPTLCVGTIPSSYQPIVIGTGPGVPA